MEKDIKKKTDIDYLKLFKKSLAMSFSLFIFGVQGSYATTITGDSAFDTVARPGADGEWIISGGKINNGTGFHHFFDFILSQGDTANMAWASSANRYVNLVDNQIQINGIFNAFNGSVPGNVVFVSPNGMIVGASGVMNVGSLQTITPNVSDYNDVVALGRRIKYENITALKNDSSTSSTDISGSIFAQNSVNIGEANKITIGRNANIVSGFNADGFNKTKLGDLSGIVNSSGIVDSQYLSGTSGSIKLTSKEITSQIPGVRGSLIHSTGNVVIDTPSAAADSTISIDSRIEAGKDVTIGHRNGEQTTDITSRVELGDKINAQNIKISGDTVSLMEGADLTTTAEDGSITVDVFRELNANSNMTAGGNISLDAGTISQGENTTIKSTNQGNIVVSGILNQSSGSEILNEGIGNISVETPNAVNIEKLTAKNGGISLNTGTITLNNTISATQDVDIRASSINQTRDDFTAIETDGGINFNILTGGLGSDDQAIKVSAGDDVTINTGRYGANIHGTGDNDLTISSSSSAYLKATSDNGINITGNITASTGDVTFDANTGINQSKNSEIYTYGGDVSFTNKVSGDISTGKVNSETGNIVVSNTAAGGVVNINNSLTANDSLTISSQGGINQAADADIVHNGSGELSITNSVAGDMNLHNITNNTGNIVLKNDAENGNIAFNNLTGTHGFVDITTKGNVTQKQDGLISAGAKNPLNNNSVNINAGGETSLQKVTGTDNIDINSDSVVLNNLIKSENGTIDITSKNDITQTIQDSTLEAAGDITLTSTAGNVGSDGQRVIVQTDGNVNVDANLSANIEGKDTDIILSQIKAGTDYNLGTTGDGNIILGGAFHNENGSIKLDTDKTLNITDDITAAGDISLISKDGIIQTDGTNIESGLGDAVSGNIEITNFGGNGITLTDVTAHKGGVRVENVETATGDVSVGNISATGGDIYVSNNSTDGNLILNSVISTDSNVELDARGDIKQSTSNLAINAGNNIDLTADGNIGSSDSSIKLNADNLVNATGSDIYLDSPGADIRLGTVSSDSDGGVIRITTSDYLGNTNKNIILTDLVSGANIDLNARGSILQETDNVKDKTIEAGNSLKLTANTGDIGDSTGDEVKTIGFSSGGTLSANATSGSIALNGIDTDIDTTNVNAAKNIDLFTTNSGNIIVSNPQNVTGHINLDSAENVELKQKINATDNITINAQKDIIQDSSLTGASLTTDKDINITAANAGTAEKGIVVDAKGEVNVGTADRHAGNIYLEDESGDFVIGQMYADNNLSLKAQGNILQSNPDEVAIYSAGSITLRSELGSIGSAQSGVENALKVNITGEDASLNITKAQDVNVASPDSNLSVGNIDATGNVTLSNTGSSGGMELNGLINAQDVTLNAIDDIVQSKDYTDKAINASGALTLVSSTGNIGALEENGGAIKFSSDSLSAKAAQGSVYLNGIETTINTQDIVALNDIDLTTTGSGDINVNEDITAKGHIKLNAADELNLSGNLTADDYIDVAANGGDILLNSILTAKTDINVTANGSIKQEVSNNDTVLNAGRDINLSANSDIGSVDKSILLNADGIVTVNKDSSAVPLPGNVYITSQNKTLNAGVINSTGTVKVSATGNNTDGSNSDVVLKDKISAQDIDINAQGSIIQDIAEADTSSLDAKGNLTLTANKGNIGQSGNSLDFSTGGSLSASAAEGSVYLNGIDTDINTSSIIAKNDIDLSTQNSGKITVSNDIETSDGYVRLDSAESLVIDKNIKAGKHIILNANGGINQTAGVIQSGTNAATAQGDGGINITNKNGGDINVTNASANKGNISINNEAVTEESGLQTGNITIGNITSSGTLDVTNAVQDGNVTIQGGINSGKSITIGAAGSIFDDGTILSAGLVAQDGNIILNAIKDIGTDENHVRISINNGSFTADGNNIYVDSYTNDLNIAGINSHKDNANGTVDINTVDGGDIVINGLIKGGDVILNSSESIQQGASITKAIEAVKDVSLTAQNGSIGSAGSAIMFSAGGNLSASASEAVVLNGIDTDIITSSINAGTDIDLSTTIDKDPSKGNIIVNNSLNADNGYISLNSAKGLNVNHDITASKNINLVSQDGNISINSAIVSDSYIGINANGDIIHLGGSITANGADVSGNAIDIDATGDITLANITAQGGKVTVDATVEGKNVTLSGVIDATTNDIEINSAGSINQTTSDNALTTSSNVVLNAAQNIGSNSNSILINADGTIKADGGDIYLGSKDKNLNIAGINSDKPDANGIVNLKTDTGKVHFVGLVKGGNVTVDSATAISQDSGLDKSIDAQNINLITNNGSIGESGNALDIKVQEGGKVDASAQGDIYLNSPEGDLTTGTITANNHTVDINSSAALRLDGLITAKDAILTAVNDITQNESLDKSIQASTVNLTSTQGSIGESAQEGKPANAIDFSATDSLRASAKKGSIVLNGVNTSITTDSIEAGVNIDLSTTGAGSSITVTSPLNAQEGYISLNSADALVLNGDLTAKDFVSLAAKTDILLNHIITSNTSDIIINAAGKITQDSNNTTLNANKNISLSAGGDIGANNQSIMLNAGGNVDATGQNIYLTSPNQQLNISSVTSTNGGTVKLSTTGDGNVHLAGLVKGGNVTIDSAKSITQDSSLDKSIEADSNLLLNANDGDIGEAAVGDVEANAIDFSAGTVEAHSTGGSVVLNGVESDINTSSIIADKNIDLTTTTSGTITVSSALNAANGYVNLDSVDGLTLNENVTAKEFVSLGSKNGDIILNSIVTAGTDINIDTDANIVQQINDVALNANNDINIINAKDVGSADKSVLVNANNSVNVESSKNVYLEDTSGDFTIGQINADNYIKLTANGNLLQADYSKNGVISGGNVDLISKTANIGESSANSIKTSVSGLVNADAANGSIYLASDGTFKAGNITAKNSANVKSAQDISLNGLIKANEVNLNAQNDITQINDGKTIEATGGNINLYSESGNIGTPNGNAIGFSLQGGGVVNADAERNGSVVLKGIDSDISTSTIKAKNDIDLTTTASGNITVTDALNAGGYISLDSANSLELNKNLTAQGNIELVARDGDVLIDAIIDGSSININSSQNVSQVGNLTTLISDGNISIIAGNNIGSDSQSMILQANGDVTATGNDIYLSSPDTDFNIGSITANGLVQLESGANININDNILANNSVDINAQDGISQNAQSSITSNNSNVSIIANNGDMNLAGSVVAKNGDLTITNNSTGNNSLSVNKITAGGKFDITHFGNGLLSVNGALNNNGNSTITANSSGSDSGIVLNGSINNNKGSLNITSNGQAGTQIKGNINNDLINDSSGAHSDITIQNNAGALSITSSQIENGKTNGSGNTLTIINNGDGGLSISSNIINKGVLNVENNSGSMNIAGAIDAELGSKNTFTQGGNADLTINSDIENKGTELTFANTGTGNLVLGENAMITVYSVLDNGNIYTGTLNLNNSGTGGKIQIDGKISGLDNAPVGSINITNSATGSDSGISFGATSGIDAKNNSVTISNNKGGIGFSQGVDVKTNDKLTINNTGDGGITHLGGGEFSASGVEITDEGIGNISFGDDMAISSDADLNITKDAQGSIIFGNNANLSSNSSINLSNNGVNTSRITFGNDAVLSATKDITLVNMGTDGISLGASSQITSGQNINIENNGNSGINFGDSAVITSKNDTNITNTGANGGVVFNNNATINTDGKLVMTNSGSAGISLGSGSKVNSKSDMTLDNQGAEGIDIEQTTTLTSGGKLYLKNTGAQGITIDGVAKGNSVQIENENSDVNIAHDKANGSLIADGAIDIDITNGSLLNSTTNSQNNTGILAGSTVDINVTGGSIGKVDENLNIVQDGFSNLNPDNAIHISAGGVVNASADNDLNILSNKNINFGTVSAQDAILATINGSISANNVNTNNLYLLAQGSGASINIDSLTNSGTLSSESVLDTVINSEIALNADSMLSKNGSIKIHSEGNTYINEIAAANDITINVEDEKLTINNLGRVERDTTIIPKTVNLTVKDAKRPHSGSDYRPGMSYDEINNVGPNSKLDIYNAYVQDKVTLKADTITAQVYDISDGAQKGDIRVDANGNKATGFHNANKNGQLLEFDIQGANYAQEDVGSNPHNSYYQPDADDKHALNVHITIGDSVDGAELGATFKKLYSDYAFVDTVVSDPSAYSTIMLESGIIGEKAIFRNNKFRVDVNNTDISQDYPINIHYDDEPDEVINNKTSFNLKMSDTIEVDVKPISPVNPDYVLDNDPNKIVKIPTVDSLTKEPNPDGDDNSAVNSEKSTAYKNIAWVVRNLNNDVIGASDQIHDPIVKSLVGISQKGVLMIADTNPKTGLKKGDVLHIQMKKDNASFNIDGKVSDINGEIVEIGFINIDKLTENVMLFWCMEQENL